MPREAINSEISVPASPEKAWKTMTDVPTLVSWVALLKDAQTISELEKYTAVLQDKIGMFSMKADLDITVAEYSEPDFITVHASGEDRQVASRIAVEVTVRLVPTDDGGTLVSVKGTYEVSGRVATLGSGTIKKKADRVLNDFFTSMERELQ